MEKHIFLIGFMGVGKSTISARLGRLLAVEPIEMDDYIEKKQGMKISKIFETYGETYFRDCESQMLLEMHEKEPTVISCGGGVPLRAENVALMRQSGCVVWLTADPEAILKRVRNNTNRPLLNGHMNVAYISDLMDARREYYERAADFVIDTTGKSIARICEEVLQTLGVDKRV